MRQAEVKLQRQVGTGEKSRNTDTHFFHAVSIDHLFCYETRAVSVPEAGPAGEKGIGTINRGIGMERDGGDIELLRLATTVESFDVLKNMGELMATKIH